MKPSVYSSMLALSIIAWCACTASADIAIKKLIMRDCAKARVEFANLAPEKRGELAVFLSLLLKQRPAPQVEINLDGSPVTKKISPFDSPLDEGSSGDLWRYFDPGHETDAKRCALDLLMLLGKDAFVAIPSVIELSSDKATPEQVRERLAETMLAITSNAVKDPSFIPEQSVVRFAVDGLSQSYRAFSEIFLIELGARGIPPLLLEIKKPDSEKRNRIAMLLPMIDPEGLIVGGGLEDLLRSGDVGLRIKAVSVLPKLTGYTERGIPLLVMALSDLSTEVQDEAIKALRAIPKPMWQQYGATSDVVKPALELLKMVPIPRRQPLSELLEQLITSVPTAENSLVPLINLADDDLRVRAMHLLSLLPSISDATFESIALLAGSPSQPVRIQAIKTMSAFPQRKSQTLDTLLAILKKQEKGEGLTDRVIAEVAARLASPGDQKRFAPYLISYLPLGSKTIDDPISAFFVRMGSTSVQVLLPILKGRDYDKILAALSIVRKSAPKDPKIVSQEIALLKSSQDELFTLVQAALVDAGEAAVPQLKKLLKNQPNHVRFAAARLLALQGIGETNVQSTLFEGLLSEDCTTKGEILALISKLQGGLSRQLTGPLLQCARMKSLSPEAFVSVLVRLKPFSDETRLELLDLVRDPLTERLLKLKLLEAWNVLGLPEADVSAILISLLGSEDNALRYASFNVLRSMHDKAKPMIPKIIEFIENNNLEPLLRHEAVLTVVEIDPSVFDYVGFFIREFKNDRADWAVRSLKRLKPNELSAVLQKAVDILTVEDRVPVIRLIGELPPEIALPFVPKILPLLTSRIALLRYTAVITLLKVAPHHPEIVPAFRRELIDSQRHMLLKESLPVSVKPILEGMLPGVGSRVEEMGIRELLVRIEARD